jgi:hypothetical protein
VAQERSAASDAAHLPFFGLILCLFYGIWCGTSAAGLVALEQTAWVLPETGAALQVANVRYRLMSLKVGVEVDAVI